ncbi:hypothetical protein AVEN_186541-1 [Araneus ventricosus]|uniref:Uncharacterized protein n=1 Tax=Araneus ventricosus TaxID=182803 RepID=A0A4Y2QLE5_ARAVE|nr:hypothetical protein AVEN_186541-1 [Araneus ventricosus]
MRVNTVWLYLRPVLKQHEGYFGTNLAISNLGQMTRIPPGLAPTLQASAPHQRDDVWPPTCNRPIQDGSAVESGFEPGTLRLKPRP